MKVLTTRKEVETYLQKHLSDKDFIGFVPTMGALHKGHLSLIDESKKNNKVTVASIFVNPTQFDNPDDLKKYPRTFDKDVKLLENIGCDFVFAPSVNEIYQESIDSESFDFDGLENEMEGKCRIGHFDGVGTIVKTLFKIIQPNTAYFGEKDFQQLQIIKKMVKKNKLPVKVIGCPIYRESNGLAMSSRNERLSKDQRENASIIYSTLKEIKSRFESATISELKKLVENKFENHPKFKLEYFSIANEETLKPVQDIKLENHYRAFIAVYAGSIRLIDNLALYN